MDTTAEAILERHFLETRAKLIELAATKDIELLNVFEVASRNGMAEALPFYQPQFIPANTYEGVTHATASFFDSSLWIANKNVKADIVYKALTEIFSTAGLKYLINVKSTARQMSVKGGITGVVTPLHKGAERFWKEKAIKAYEAGPVANVEWLHSLVPEGWRKIPNPYPTTEAGLARGHKIYQDFCISCHGPIGDGMGPAQPYLYPPPLNFTILKGRGISGGILHYQIMNGITGSAMPYFKRELESQKIWEVGDYVAVYFIDESDANAEPRGIDASWEP